VDIVSATFFPVILANAIGMFVFAYLISNIIKERKTRTERNQYQSELYKKKSELEIAARIQNGFLPKKLPLIKGFDLYAKNVPALEVGGDFYDFITLPNGRFGLVIADVSGKGVPAALFMVLSKTFVRASAEWHSNAAETIEEANTLISQDSESGMFVTLFYAIIDGEKRVLSYTNAGHNPPLVLWSETNEFDTLPATGIALGAMENLSYESGEISLGKDDLVVFYTDGITEAINSPEEAYGEERLKSVIAANRNKSPEEISNAILDDVVVFCGDEPQFDDITMMILKGN
jgi:sigma-B regulation protein RsbU (phosphoserine phosphatase)